MTYDTAKIGRLVAERVMGWVLEKKNGWSSYWEHHSIGKTKKYVQHDWSPSTDMNHAGEVIEGFVGSSFYSIDNGWRLIDGERVGGHTCRMVVAGHPEAEATAATIPLAICLASLKAVGVDPKEVENA
jgi:hypothetical protein